MLGAHLAGIATREFQNENHLKSQNASFTIEENANKKSTGNMTFNARLLNRSAEPFPIFYLS